MSALTRKHNFDEVFDSQGVFRLVLEAMSNPVRKVNLKKFAIKLFADNPSMLALGLTLLDNEVSFYTCGNHVLSDEIISLTLAKKTDLAFADYIFVCNKEDLPSAIQNAKCGALADPQKSATVIINNSGDSIYEMNVVGPGIAGQVTIGVSQIVRDALQYRDQQCYEFQNGK